MKRLPDTELMMIIWDSEQAVEKSGNHRHEKQGKKIKFFLKIFRNL